MKMNRVTFAKTLLLVVAVLLIGCSSYTRMSNEEIIKQTKLCRDSGLDVTTLSTMSGEIVAIQCNPLRK